MKVISITSLIEEKNGIKGIYGIDLHDLHTPRNGGEKPAACFGACFDACSRCWFGVKNREILFWPEPAKDKTESADRSGKKAPVIVLPGDAGEARTVTEAGKRLGTL